jgi:F0F1-type ATP synthase epsilon subunit
MDRKEGALSVKIETPTGVIWEGEAESVSSRNNAGEFDILPEHANMITLVVQAPIVIATASEEKRFEFGRAVISVRDNRIAIYADISTASTDESVTV